jgi:hypothetical protein
MQTNIRAGSVVRVSDNAPAFLKSAVGQSVLKVKSVDGDRVRFENGSTLPLKAVYHIPKARIRKGGKVYIPS